MEKPLFYNIEYGTLHEIGHIQKGVSKNGKEWKIREISLKKSNGIRSEVLYLKAWDDDAENIAKYEPGDLVKVEFSLIGNDYKGFHKNEAYVLSIEPSSDDTREAVKNRERAAQQASRPVEAPVEPDKEDDDLPF